VIIDEKLRFSGREIKREVITPLNINLHFTVASHDPNLGIEQICAASMNNTKYNVHRKGVARGARPPPSRMLPRTAKN